MTTNDEQMKRETVDDEPRYSLSELTDEAGVSVRTVRYYIAEGLLPPPVTAGPRSFYAKSHLDRLRLIDRMKASYLPLKEIRRRLTALDDDEIRRLAEPEAAARAPRTAAPRAIAETAPRPSDSASSYIARLLHRQTPAPPAAPAAPAPSVHLAVRTPDSMRGEAGTPFEELGDEAGRFLVEPIAAPSAGTVLPLPDTEVEAGSWRRISLGEDAELLIRDEIYQRKRDRVDWLVGWARKVFG
jgi:DNA-binding transcriptional MerR regulator